MATVLPFQAVRPTRELARDVAALPYDAYSREEAYVYVQDKPLSFLNIDRPETQFAPDFDQYAPEVYEKAREMLASRMADGTLIKDQQPCFYIYELKMGDHLQTGIMGLSSIDDYMNDVCKKHEKTIYEKEKDRIAHVSVTSAQTGPIFLAYRAKKDIDELVARVKQGTPVYSFIADDGIRHQVWIVADREDVAKISDCFQEVPATYIADGHHRAASAVKVGLSRRAAHPDYDGHEEFNYFLSILFPDHDLQILDYNRIVLDFNGHTLASFQEAIKDTFTLEPIAGAMHPSCKGSIAMYHDHQWYILKIKDEVIASRQDSPVDALDVAILQDLLLAPVLGIGDPRSDKRIQFVGGIRGLKELEQRVDKTKDGVAFAMYPTDIQELFKVADAALLMPPKSTWFEPKPRSGLFIHEIER